MENFKFIINNNSYVFLSEMNDESIRDILKRLGNYNLEISYCLHRKGCDCDNGHFVTTLMWVQTHPTRTYVGQNTSFCSQLFIEKNNEWVPYLEE